MMSPHTWPCQTRSDWKGVVMWPREPSTFFSVLNYWERVLLFIKSLVNEQAISLEIPCPSTQQEGVLPENKAAEPEKEEELRGTSFGSLDPTMLEGDTQGFPEMGASKLPVWLKPIGLCVLLLHPCKCWIKQMWQLKIWTNLGVCVWESF